MYRSYEAKLTTSLTGLNNEVEFKFENWNKRISYIALESCAAPVSCDYKRKNLKCL